MRRLKGIVTSDKMAKTVTVRVDRLKQHPKYLKYYKVSRKIKAHDEKKEFMVGDEVIIQETKPLSKEKRWRVAELVKRNATEQGKEEEDETKEP